MPMLIAVVYHLLRMRSIGAKVEKDSSWSGGMKATLKKPALLSILCAAAETFKKESFLLLVGHRGQESFTIEHAIAMQTAKRNFTGVKTVQRRYSCVWELVSYFWRDTIVIGDAHSHTEFEHGNKTIFPLLPSTKDCEGAEQGDVYIIVGVSNKKKTMRWKKTTNQSLSGTLGQFRFEIKAYWSPENKKLEPIDLVCPALYRLDAYKHKLDSKTGIRYT